MANQEHIDRLKQGVEHWNQWRQEHPEIQPDLSNADLRGANLSGANLSDVNLRGANLNGTSLRKANLRCAHLSDPGRHSSQKHIIWHVAIAYQSSVIYNLVKNDLYGADLSSADLRGADLSGADLSDASFGHADLSDAALSDANISDANLRGANLNRANLSSANLSGTILSGADMRSAALGGANLYEANLSGADLYEANLHGANLSSANLSGANLRGAEMQRTTFANVDFRTVKGLAEIQHSGPSPVALYTIQLPQDGSTLHFLRGTGVPDEWIDDYRAHMISPIQYHSLFISYSSKDDILARRLHADLQDHGVRCWFAPEDMKIGDKIRARIDEAIHLQDKLLLLLSEHALSSLWVEDEVESALEKEQRQQREVLFPVRLDESVMQTSQAWAAKLRRARHIGDFTRWMDPQAYQQAFDRLLRDLKAENDTKGEPGGKPGTS